MSPVCCDSFQDKPVDVASGNRKPWSSWSLQSWTWTRSPGRQKLLHRAIHRLLNPYAFCTYSNTQYRSKDLVFDPMAYKYTSIDDASKTRPEHWLRSWRGEISLAILIAVFSSVATFGITSLLSHKEVQAQPLSCGKTFEEAHSHGCTFDALTLTWLRPECSQHGNEAFSEAAGNETWRYWQEEEGGVVELGHYESLAYLPPGTLYLATYDQYLTHCMWILLRVHNALEHGKRLDFQSISYEHSKDCLGLLLREAKHGVGNNLTQLSTHAVANEIDYGVC